MNQAETQLQSTLQSRFPSLNEEEASLLVEHIEQWLATNIAKGSTPAFLKMDPNGTITDMTLVEFQQK